MVVTTGRTMHLSFENIRSAYDLRWQSSEYLCLFVKRQGPVLPLNLR